jgi:ABC-type branched-subunit amino acid transport system substrate-binding protein
MSRSLAARGRLAVLAVLLLTSVAVSCGSDDDGSSAATTTTSGKATEHVALSGVPGVTDTEIRFSAFGTDSNNPLGTCTLKCYTEGIQAYFDFRNDDGGIYGRKLVLADNLDDELGKNQQRALEITSKNDTFAAFSATLIASGWATVAKAGMPLFALNIFPTEGADPGIFGHAPVGCIACTSRATAYVIKLAKAKKVASLGYGVSENSKVCASSIRSSVEKYTDDIGGATVAYFNDGLSFGLNNGIGPEVTAMKKAGVDMILTCLDINGMKTLAQELERQGMGDVPMLHPNTYDQAFVKAAGDLFEGDYVSVAFRPFESKTGGSALAEFKKWMAKDGYELSEHAMDGWINADEAYTGIKAAGPSFDRAKVIAAMNEVEDYTAGGLVTPVDFGRQHELATEADPATHGSDPQCTALVKVHDGAFTVVGDAAKPFLCWPGDTRAWSEPEPTNFK